MLSLTSLGLLPGEAFELLTHPSFESSSQGGGATENVFDASDRAEGGDLAFWWNDTANTISMLIDRSYLTRIGFVPVVETEDGMKMARVFCYLTQNYGPLPTILFIRGVRECILTTIVLTH